MKNLAQLGNKRLVHLGHSLESRFILIPCVTHLLELFLILLIVLLGATHVLHQPRDFRLLVRHPST